MLPRLLLFTLVLFCLELGVFLVVLPWTGIWERNFFLFRYPELAGLLLDFRLRGAISGLGLVDIGLGAWYAAHFRLLLSRWQGAEAEKAKQPQESLHGGQTA
ncbi:MAG: hypothetical protein ACRD4D_05750 [Candidatus Acidiferrales bacterium]